ncbi:manganese efflux pump [Clostridium sp. CM028]|uniref:manganese efflux pump n=1 Tax=unclassified Clostridium TaxID=2614128 RepID=UPI001C0DE847|nr:MULTISPECIES: manganese efflux pump [unclassified Clostridium]MBU3092161.1 manganese efflux pump [Clostridium sp. CF011]MBW9149131.1 manganese efflux pump [Clostridium sp. CM028]WAG70997.1 manganese efflux pump [Clostridium sp. CF011]WLC62605.1 manganese efflux pump [Clostridium sp. CM028]
MSLIISALSFSLSSNLDNAVVGIAYGIKKVKIGIIANLIIAIVTSVGTLLSMLIGAYISKFLPHSIANGLGAIVIIILGVYFIIQSIVNLLNKTNSKALALKNISEMIDYAEESDLDNSGDINMKEALIVAFGLTFNNLGTGVAASITGVNIQLTVISTFILSILTIIFGEAVGNHVLGEILGKYAPLFSGILLIILGIIEFVN